MGQNPTWGGGAASIIYADAGNDTIFGDDQTDTYYFMGETAVTGSANAWDASGVSLSLGNVATTSSSGQSVNDATLTGSAIGADAESVELTDGNDTVVVSISASPRNRYWHGACSRR